MHLLGAIDNQGQLTLAGKKMARFGTEPRLAAMLLYGQKKGAIAFNTAARLVAILEHPPHYTGNSDIFILFNQPNKAWLHRAEQLRQREHIEKTIVDSSLLSILLAVAFPDRIAAKRNITNRYLLANGSGVELDQRDSLYGTSYLIVTHLLQPSNALQPRILLAIACEPALIIDHFPTLLSDVMTIQWLEKPGTLRSVRRKQIGHIVLNEQTVNKPSQDEYRQALMGWLRQQGIGQLDWTTSASQLCTRLICAKQWFTEFDWPSVDEDALLAHLDVWLLPDLDNIQDIKSLKQINITNALKRLMNWQQIQQLDRWLPTHYRLPTGNQVPINYHTEQPPMISARIQELFGEQENPKIAQDKITVIIELLSPANRVLHITSDLANFWQRSYRDVQKEMKGRYPKHF